MSDTRDDQHGARDGAIKALCRTLKMPTIAREFASTERVALAEGWAPGAYLQTLLDAEASTRTEHAVERRLRAARLPARKTLAQFDWRRGHGVERARVEALARCEWVAKARNIVMLGPVGTGKTHLAIALAMAAMARGYGAMFFRASELVRALSEARDTRQLGRLHERLQRSEVLVLDELGFVPSSGQVASCCSTCCPRATSAARRHLQPLLRRVEPRVLRRQAHGGVARSARSTRRRDRDPRAGCARGRSRFARRGRRRTMRATVATSRRGVATRGVTRRRGRMARRVKLATAVDPPGAAGGGANSHAVRAEKQPQGGSVSVGQSGSVSVGH